ncbi:MAG: drug/metabolite transporter (DMT)-like permease [Candidatus Paceibacteria bacterium]|jgi:drug/metabolite transporter (DMT)-like permease
MPNTQSPGPQRTLVLTVLALFAFAGNSVLCRLALGDGAIDAASFTIVRLLSGAIVLSLLCRMRSTSARETRGGWTSACVLCIYAIAFSFAYTTLQTGVGALILFGTVQLTMLTVAVAGGERISLGEWVGVSVALSGFAYLVLPGASAPPVMGSMLMALAGIGWGSYTLLGRGSSDPMGDNARTFVHSLPILALLAVVRIGQEHYSAPGIAYAVTSGAIASGVGYTLWYSALRGLSTTTAAVVQLSVPIIAAGGGVLFMNESISPRLALSAGLILGGIGWVTLAASRRRV